MGKRFLAISASLLILLSITFVPSTYGSARTPALALAFNAYDLIDAVNALRASRGLAAYRVNSILMRTAQAQADYMASIGAWTHTGPGGTTVTQRLLAAGYPLAGDLSLGGFRAENVCQETQGTTPQEVVSECWSDAQHMDTMLSTELVDIGAGISTSGGYTYFDIDCARPTSSGQQQLYTPSVSGTPETQEPTIAVAIVSTPDENGNVYHIVQPGQSLWQIASAYKTTINQIKRLNGLIADNIYVGQKLLIGWAGTATPIPPSATMTHNPSTATPLPTFVIVTETMTATATSVPVAPVSGLDRAGGAVLAIILVALVAAGLVAWIGRGRPA